MWRWLHRRAPTRPVHVVNGRERAAAEALQAAERKAANVQRLARRADLLADEMQRALGLRQ